MVYRVVQQVVDMRTGQPTGATCSVWTPNKERAQALVAERPDIRKMLEVPDEEWPTAK